MKRFLCLFLAVCMLGAPLGVQASAPPQNEQLEAVTKLVRAQLGTYLAVDAAKFYGDKSEGAEECWSLHWEAPGHELSVDALADGTILWYRLMQETELPGGGEFAPSLPKYSRAQAESAANAFLKCVLRPKETVVFSQDGGAVRPLNTKDTGLSGTIYYDGIPTPTQFDLRLSMQDLSVQFYSRSSETRLGAIPAKTPTVALPAAQEQLKTTYRLRLQYTTDMASGESSTRAVLRYVPQRTDEFFVDAQTGKLVNLTELRDKVMAGNEAAAAPADGAANDKLSEAEQEGAAKLKDVLAKDVLDGKLRAVTELGLSDLTLAGVRYAPSREDESVQASLQYTKNAGKDSAVSKNLTVDAKTGALLSMYTYYGSASARTADTGADAQKKAAAFLQKYQTEDFAKCALLQETDDAEELTYAQQVNGHPFPENAMRLRINRASGTVDSFWKSWNPDVTFDAADGTITADAARSSFMGAQKIMLCYVSVPVKLDPRQYAEYISRGYTYLSEWKLGYSASSGSSCMGIDAKTGDAVLRARSDGNALSYADVTEKTHPQAFALAQYGIGFAGGTLQPTKPLTQVEMVALLMSADGYTYDPAREESSEQLYEAAYRSGILTRAEYAPTSAVSRAVFVKTLIACTGYGRTAALPGIYRCAFTDEKSIPQAYYGYVATAQGMGIVRGDEKGCFQPNETATREQAILMLHSFMSR